jgi:catechol 2,3-dioxygenase-like lactoylglutathione lyase family enzyme
MIKARGLKHINLNVSDLSRSFKFYQDAFAPSGLAQRREERSPLDLRLPGRRSAAARGIASGPARCRNFISLPQCGQLTSSYLTMRPQNGHL